MKSALLTLAVSAAALVAARADDCALVTLKVGKEKELRQFAIEFHEADAPATVENFKKLGRKGFYKGTAIHRAFPNTLLQFGDPLSKDKDRTKVGTGGRSVIHRASSATVTRSRRDHPEAAGKPLRAKT